MDTCEVILLLTFGIIFGDPLITGIELSCELCEINDISICRLWKEEDNFSFFFFFLAGYINFFLT